MLSNDRLWGKRLKFGRWTEYDLRELAFGAIRGPIRHLAGITSDEFQIEGSDDGVTWDAVSPWWIDEKRRAAETAAVLKRVPPGVLTVAGKRGRRRGSGIDTLVRHLRDREGIRDYERIVSVLEASKIESVSKALVAWGDNAVERARDAYARGRSAHADGCDYCAFGLPPGLQAAIPRAKFD